MTTSSADQRFLLLLIAAILAVMLNGCGTRIYEGGKPVFAGYGDYGRLKYRSPAGSLLELDSANHSDHTAKTLDAAARLGIGLGIGTAGAFVP